MIRNTTKETIKIIIVAAIYLAIIGGVTYFSYDINSLLAIMDWTKSTFNNIQGPFIFVILSFICVTIVVNILGYYIMALAEHDYRIVTAQNNDMSRDTSKDGFMRRLYARPRFCNEVYNVISVLGIIVLLLAEVAAQFLIAVFFANFVMLFIPNMWVVLLVFLLSILITYRPVMYIVEWAFTRGKIPFFKRTADLEFLRDCDEEKIKAWNNIIGVLFTIYTVVITMLGIIDQEILEFLNHDNTLIFYLTIGIVGLITCVLRATKGSLRVL